MLKPTNAAVQHTIGWGCFMMAEKNKVYPTSGGMLFLLAKASKVLLILSVICGIVSGASSVGIIYLINDVLHSGAVTESQQIILFVGMLLSMTISGLVSQILLIRLGQNSMFEMRMLISRQILATAFRKLEKIGSSRLYSMLTDDIQTLVTATQSLPGFAINGATLVGGLVYLGWLSPTIFLFSLAFVVAGVATYQALARNAMRHFENARDVNDTLFDHFRAATFGAKELKLNRLRRDTFLIDEMEPTGRAYQENNVRGLTKYVLASQWGQLLFFVMIGLLVFLRPTNGNSDNSALVGSVLTVIYLMGPLGIILNMLPIFGKAGVAAKKIDSLQLNSVGDILKKPSVSSASPPTPLTAIEIKRLTYTYHGETEEDFRLGPIDLVLRPREIVFLVGGNGSGKSTLLKILTGLYEPEFGEILVNGKCVISEDEREEYRQYFSVIFADFHLFERLPQENGRNADEVLLKYLEQLQLKEKVEIIDGRFSTISLSQGQRKRLALLCAYLEDRPVYVFDEWAADQDPLFKDIFYSQILPDLRQRGKAILLATHDDRYFHLADRVIKLDSGKLVS